MIIISDGTSHLYKTSDISSIYLRKQRSTNELSRNFPPIATILMIHEYVRSISLKLILFVNKKPFFGDHNDIQIRRSQKYTETKLLKLILPFISSIFSVLHGHFQMI